MAKVLGISKVSRSFTAKDGNEIVGRNVTLSFTDDRFDGVRVCEAYCTDSKIKDMGIKLNAEVPIYFADKKWKIGESRTY